MAAVQLPKLSHSIVDDPILFEIELMSDLIKIVLILSSHNRKQQHLTELDHIKLNTWLIYKIMIH